MKMLMPYFIAVETKIKSLILDTALSSFCHGYYQKENGLILIKVYHTIIILI